MRAAKLTAGIAAFWLAANALSAHAQTALERAQQDELFKLRDDDPNMVAAMRKARATLKDFVALASKPGSTMRGFAVKVPVREGNTGEYFWITPFEAKGNRFVGRINNTPRTVRNVKAGQTIEFGEDEIADWLYVDGGRMKGNYTACALLKNEPKEQQEEFKKRFGLECDA
ncbi:MAG: DUF2314 domain-containing protein [Alphaproteobacteria bacterium]|nr:DUF2314 domain-containing protein [Alphaproteobacteria bacterium]